MSTRTPTTANNGKKKIAAIIAIILTLAIGLGGALAFTDFGQSFINRFRGSANPDILLHDDFEAGINKDVYVDNTGETPMIVRVQFAEYLQIGNTPIVGTDANNKLTWVPRMFNTAPADNGDYSDGANDDGAMPTENRHIWYMTGAQKIFKPGTGEMGSYEYQLNQEFDDGSHAKETLPESPVVLVQYYIDHKDELDARYPAGLWALDTDGYAYWTRALQPGEATNLLLDNVVLDENVAPDDNYYYAIDVRLEASNLTESYLLYSGEKDATDDGEKIIKDAVDAAKTKPAVENFTVSASGVATRAATNEDFTLTLYTDIVDRVITLTGVVSGKNLSANPGLTTWSKVSGRDGWLETASDSTTVRVVVPHNIAGDVVIKAQAKDDANKTLNITINVIGPHASHPIPAARIVDATTKFLTPAQTGDTVNWIAIAKQTVDAQEYYLIVRTKVVKEISKFGTAADWPYGTGNSILQQEMNAFWESLSGSSGLKTHAAYNNALETLGTPGTQVGVASHFAPFEGFSSPAASGSFRGVFPLSVDEAAEYMSTSWFDASGILRFNTSDGTNSASKLTAYTNWEALTMEPVDFGSARLESWLRTPVLSDGGGKRYSYLGDGGRILAAFIADTHCVRPALWVSADIFA